MRKKYTDLINEGDFLLLKSSDEYFLSHYLGSPLQILSGFNGSAGEALIEKSGKITLFVDPRYHEQADIETKDKQVEVVKLNLGEGFIKAIAKKAGKKKLFVPHSITFTFFQKLKDEGLNLSTYKEFEGFGENKNLDKTKEIFFAQGKSFEDKIKNLKKSAKSRYYLVTSLEEIAYLTNLRSYQMPNSSVFPAKLLLDFEGTYTLFCDDNLPSELKNLVQKPLKGAATVIEKIDEPISFYPCSITLGDYELIKKPLHIKKNHIATMASIKEKCDLEHLKSAFLRLDKALYNFKKQIREGLSEYELKEIFERELIKEGAKTTSFKTILAIGDNSSSIHYSSCDKNKILKNGDTILLDCGGYYEEGLATDITRVFLCGADAAPIQKEIYSAVLRAFLNAYHSKADCGADLDKIARQILDPYEKKGFLFPHALGHGIGIPVHQSPPVISSYGDKKFALKKNMAHTIEPGLYGVSKQGEKFGVRLENSVFTTGADTRESFSKFEFEENLIDYSMLTKKEKQWLEAWQQGFRGFCRENIDERK